MDSLTQIVLGAAVGEICLGKKLGNRAMLWGGIAGTIPDLDIISNLWQTPLEALASHRGITHSILFSVTIPFLLAWLVKKYYDEDIFKNKTIKTISTIISSVFIVLISSIFISFAYRGMKTPGFVAICIGLILLSTYFITRTYKYYLLEEPDDFKISYSSWYWFFFWTIFTHPILDSFTVYGTQLFMPFSDKRVSWDNISVADPAYTLPFLICLIIAAFNARDSKQRRVWNYLGITISTLYMNWTFYVKDKVNIVLENTLKSEQISYKRYMTNPTILNSLLWTGTAETDSAFYSGQYSIFDKEKKFKLTKYNKNHALLKGREDNDPTVKVLRWFSKDYYNVMAIQGDTIQINDMRYGTYKGTGEKPEDYIFKFLLSEDGKGGYEFTDIMRRGPNDDEKQMFYQLIQRIKGI